MIETINGLRETGVGFRSLREKINTTSAGGRFYAHMPVSLSGFERELNIELKKAGMASARLCAMHSGRLRKLMPHRLDHARDMIGLDKETRAATGAMFGIDVATLRRQ